MTSTPKIQEVYQRAYVRRALAETQGNVSEAARRAGVGRAFVQKIMRRHGLGRAPSDPSL